MMLFSRYIVSVGLRPVRQRPRDLRALLVMMGRQDRLDEWGNRLALGNLTQPGVARVQ